MYCEPAPNIKLKVDSNSFESNTTANTKLGVLIKKMDSDVTKHIYFGRWLNVRFLLAEELIRSFAYAQDLAILKTAC